MRRIAQLTALSLASLLLFAGLVALVSCVRIDPIVANAYAAMPVEWRTDLVAGPKATVTSLDVPAGTQRLIAVLPVPSGGGGGTVDLAGRKVWLVELKVKDPSILGDFRIYVDRETGRALGYDPRD